MLVSIVGISVNSLSKGYTQRGILAAAKKEIDLESRDDDLLEQPMWVVLPRSVSRCKEFIIWFFEGRVFEVFGD